MSSVHERVTGAIRSWNDERGFGFITPAGGGRDVFIHINDFGDGSDRPVVGDIVTFLARTEHDGKVRATAVNRIGRRSRSRRRNDRVRSRPNLLALLVIPAFAAVVYAASILWSVPLIVVAIYVAASILCFLLYWSDKSAALAGRWRQSESSLLLVGLLGGWPGALLAQELLRHKTRKPSFRSAFWVTVVLNIAAFVVLAATGLFERLSLDISRW